MTISPQVETLSKFLSMIEAKYQARGQAQCFHQTQRLLFGEILDHLPPALALAAVRRLLFFSNSFLPDPADLLLTAARLASPLPDEDAAWREVFDRLGVTHPRPLSHAEIRKTVEDLGGCSTLWHQVRFANTPVTVLRAQFLEAYRRRRDRWEIAVRETLLRPRPDWDWSVLPADNPLLGEACLELGFAQGAPGLADGL